LPLLLRDQTPSVATLGRFSQQRTEQQQKPIGD
jgi:hypothetical protein